MYCSGPGDPNGGVMSWRISIKKLRLLQFINRMESKEKGSALIIALLVTVVLSLLGLSLMFQADTEKSISINERDSFEALHVAEIGVQWAKRSVYREAHEN